MTRCISQNVQSRTLANGTIEHFEDLGERTIQNVLARGCRITTARSQDALNNGQQMTLENWVSPELRAIVVSIEHTPVSDKITEFDNIVMGEPDASLFSPPADYAVEDLNQKRDQAENLAAQLQQDAIRAEDISGPWETDDPIVGKGSQIGIFLRLSVKRAVRLQKGAAVEVGADSISNLQLDVYQKMGDQFDERSLPASSPPMSASLDGKRLQTNFRGGQEMPPSLPRREGQEMSLPQWQPGAFSNADVGLDFTFSPQDHAWTGTYTLNGTTKQVRLMRPGASSKTAPGPFAGAWTQTLAGGRARICFQIAERQDGSLIAWQNGTWGIMVRPGRPRNVPGVHGVLSPIATSGEEDGVPFIGSVQDEKLMLEPRTGVNVGTALLPWGGLAGIGIISPTGMPIRFTGTLSEDRSQFTLSPRTPPEIYTRASGGSCSIEIAVSASGAQ